MIIRLCKAWRVIRRSFFPFVREARRSFPKKRTPDRSYQYAKYRTGRCDVSSKFSCKNLSGVSCVWANQSHCKINKNALTSVESRLLGDEFLCQRPRCRYTTFRLEYKTSVVCHNVYTQKVKIARRDRLHILASNRCETFENLLHIDIAPLRSTLSGILHSKNWTMIFIGIRGLWLCQYKYT